MRLMLLVVLLSGCATAESLHADRYEGACARECLAHNSACIAGTPLAMQANCNANARQCLSTCPLK